MAFTRKKKRLIIWLVFILVVLIGAGAFAFSIYRLHIYEMDKAQKAHADEITKFQQEFAIRSRAIYVPIQDIESGSLVTEELVKEESIISDTPQDFFITKEQLGYVALTDLPVNQPILKSVVFKEEIENDVRIEEFSIFLLSSNLKKNLYVDIRINFANGEDYIVLSKKKIREVNLENNTIWLWLDEEEILRTSSAIVDAYFHEGSKLYTVVYVEPFIQEQADITYPVNQDVLNVMNNNPNILEEAKSNLLKESRQPLEKRLNQLDQEMSSKMEGERSEESSKRDAVIQQIQEENKASQEEQLKEANPEVDSTEEDNQDKGKEESNAFF